MLKSRFSISSGCPRCGQPAAQCRCASSKAKVSPEAPKLIVVVRIEKGGRGGKIVTVIEGFSRNHKLLELLSREFKARLGTGGTCGIGEKGGYLEVQGDQRERVRELLREKGIGSKG